MQTGLTIKIFKTMQPPVNVLIYLSSRQYDFENQK